MLTPYQHSAPQRVAQFDCSKLLTFISRRFSGSPPAYWARHFACALDVFELMTAFQHGQITTGGGAMLSEGNIFSFHHVKTALGTLTSQELWPGKRRTPI